MRWPKYWSFSLSIIPSKEIPGLISFRMNWLDLLAVQGTLKSLLQHHSSNTNSSALSFLHSPTLSSIHDHWKKYSLDYTKLSEKAMAPHSSTLAWKIPWTEEPGRLQSMGSLSQTRLSDFTFFLSIVSFGEGKGNPLWGSCLENPMDGGAWWAVVYGVAKSWTLPT